MAIKTKGRRKFAVGQRQFIWYVSEDDDSADIVLHVASEDKNFIVKYHLAQPETLRFIIVLGNEFPGLPRYGVGWRRVLCPEWEQDLIISPGGVRRLIDWCLYQERELTRVDYMGQPLDD